MDNHEKPIFKNDLSAEEQKNQDEAFEKDNRDKAKTQKILDIVEGISTIVSNITGQ